MFFEMLASFVQSVGALSQGSATQRSANYNSRISAYNANVTEQQGQVAEMQQRQETARKIGLLHANFGASGLSSDGSATDILQESAFNAEMDAQNIRYNYSTKAQGYRMQGNLQTMEGKNARTASYLTAASTLLTGAGKAYEQNATTAGQQPFRLGA